MAQKFSIFVYLFCIFLHVTYGRVKDLPPYFPHCYIDDPNINDCLLKATETVRPFLLKGVPELNVPPIKEFFVPEVTLQQGTDAINYKTIITNLTIVGLGNYKFTKFEFDVPNLIFIGEVLMNDLSMTASYSIEGKILAIPLQGHGGVSGKIDASNGTLWSKCYLAKENGEEYLNIEKQEIKLNVGKVLSAEWTGLFQDNEVLAKAVNGLVNDNRDELIQAVKPAIESVMSELIRKLFENSFSKVPFKNLYPRRNKTK